MVLKTRMNSEISKIGVHITHFNMVAIVKFEILLYFVHPILMRIIANLGFILFFEQLPYL